MHVVCSRILALAVVMCAIAGCSKAKSGGDSAGVRMTPAGDASHPADTAARPDGARLGRRAPAKDAADVFLRMMADHHQGLLELSRAAASQTSDSGTKADARGIEAKQGAELENILSLARRLYADSIAPVVMPSNRAMLDSLSAVSRAGYERAFYRTVVAHHEETIRMIDESLPKLTVPTVKRLAETMKAERRKELTMFRKTAQ